MATKVISYALDGKYGITTLLDWTFSNASLYLSKAFVCLLDLSLDLFLSGLQPQQHVH